MNENQAIEFVDAVRRAGGELTRGLRKLEEGEVSDNQQWRMAVAEVLGVMQDLLLNPVFDSHPGAKPKELGGTR